MRENMVRVMVAKRGEVLAYALLGRKALSFAAAMRDEGADSIRMLDSSGASMAWFRSRTA